MVWWHWTSIRILMSWVSCPWTWKVGQVSLSLHIASSCLFSFPLPWLKVLKGQHPFLGSLLSPFLECHIHTYDLHGLLHNLSFSSLSTCFFSHILNLIRTHATAIPWPQICSSTLITSIYLSNSLLINFNRLQPNQDLVHLMLCLCFLTSLRFLAYL